MSDRRTTSRSDSADRRSWPRPPVWLNLLLLTFSALIAILAFVHHRQLNERFAKIAARGENSPEQIRQAREQLAEMDLTREQLHKELQSRAALLQTLQSDQFYIAIDTKKGRLNFNLGNEIVRDAPVQIGPPASVQGAGRVWTFVPLKGLVQVTGKSEGETWTPAPWVYLVNKQPVPPNPPAVANGLGRYVIDLENGYIIHSQPSPDSPLKGPKPGSFLVPEEDLRAIWPRIHAGTRVYVF